MTRTDALSLHGSRLSSGVHVTEANHGLNRDVIDSTGNHHLGLTQSDLVPAFFNGYGCGCAGANRLHHRTITTDEGLHYVCGHNVRQGLLQNVTGAFLVEEAANEHLAHRLHAPKTGALSGGHIGRVHSLQQLGGAETSVEEGLNGGNQVPRGDPVQRLGHGCRDAPTLRVEVTRELATHGAAQRGAARYAGQ